MDRVELQCARREGRGRRWGRWVWRRGWVVLILVAGVLGWVYRGEILRKGRVMAWQRRMMSMSVPAGRVVYECRDGEAARVLVGGGEYESDAFGGACWRPVVWREFSALDVGSPGGQTLWGMPFVSNAGVIFCGELIPSDGRPRWVVATYNKKVIAVYRSPCFHFVQIFFYEPETLRRRAAIRDSLAPDFWMLPGEVRGNYCVYSGDVAADNRSAFEFEVRDMTARYLVRGRLRRDDSFEVTWKTVR